MNIDLQKNKWFQFSQRGRNSSSDVVVIQVQANQTLQTTKLHRNCPLNVIFIKLPDNREKKRGNDQSNEIKKSVQSRDKRKQNKV